MVNDMNSSAMDKILAKQVTDGSGNFLGFYSTEIYKPISEATDAVRDFLRKVKGKKGRDQKKTLLRCVSWKLLITRKPIFLTELKRVDGNVSIPELGIICQFARSLRGEGLILEIGTFDGRTALDLSLNACNYKIITLNLPEHDKTRFNKESGEEHFKESSGKRFIENTEKFPEAVKRIHQVYGDSATFDFKSYEGKCDLVFVDGSHDYEYVRKDSETAFRLCSNKGIILWHDYGIRKGVTRGLEEIEREKSIGLIHIRGTSLVVLKMNSSY